MATAVGKGRRATVIVLAAAALLAALVISPASAGTGTAALSCPSTVERPFVRWLDPLAYTLAPGGDFEASHGWRLLGGAKVVAGNEPFKVHSSTDARSLSLPAGASAVSPAFCVGLGEPTLRFFAVGGGSLLSALKVEVLYPTVLGTASQTVALVPRMRSWGPTLQTPVIGNVLGLASLSGTTTMVQVRVTALGGGWNVDDVYVDPWKVT